MSEFATLKIVDGDFLQGFQVILRTGKDGNSTATETDGWFPPAPELPQLCDNWQLNYRNLEEINFPRALKASKGQVTNYSIIESANHLTDGINHWLNSGDAKFQPFRDKLIGHLQKNDRIRFIIQTDNVQLWRIPWHLWKVLESCKVEVNISASGYQQVERVTHAKNKKQIRILVILGDSTGINVEKDLDFLQKDLPNAEIVTLRNPKEEQLTEGLWEQEWDILFFAGHSSSQGANFQGKFYISQNESLTIGELKSALNNAIEHGLKLAIFNSCDGLGLGRELAGLQIPATIAMRERVPDEVAQKFLEYFLKAFAKKGKSLSASVREARERLRELEEKYPCASWLPVICHNPAEDMPTWDSLLGLPSPLESDSPNSSTIQVGLDAPIGAFNWLLNVFIKYKFRMVALCLLGAISSYTVLPQFSHFSNQVGLKFRKSNQFENALFFYEFALKLYSDNASASANIAEIEESLQEFNSAAEGYKRAKIVSAAACNNEAHLILIGKHETLGGQYERAENQLMTCLQQAKSTPAKYAILKNLGWALLKQGKYDEAENALRDAIKLIGDRAPAYCLLAQVLEAQKDNKNALVQWKNCLTFGSEFDPDEKLWLPDARQRLKAAEKELWQVK